MSLAAVRPAVDRYLAVLRRPAVALALGGWLATVSPTLGLAVAAGVAMGTAAAVPARRAPAV